MKLRYVTTNQDKFNKAQVNLTAFDIDLIQVELELTEPQTLDGTVIVAEKAKQAFQHLQQPVMVSDDSWAISALNGFPATMMKHCNHFLLAEDWLRLMAGISNRDITLHSYLAYSDGGQPLVLSYQQPAYFLTQAQGEHRTAPHLTVIAWQGETQSVAEQITQGKFPTSTSVWHDFAQTIKNSSFSD